MAPVETVEVFSIVIHIQLGYVNSTEKQKTPHMGTLISESKNEWSLVTIRIFGYAGPAVWNSLPEYLPNIYVTQQLVATVFDVT